MKQQTVRLPKKVGGFLAAAGLFILTKLKFVIGLLKFSKFGVTLISLIVSLGGYAVFFGWKFGVALVYLIFVHEMGHLVAAKQKGIKTSPAVFIPFVGALISMKEQPRDAKTEAYLAYGGPLAGLISFLPAVLLLNTTGEAIWGLVILLGAMLNLFNLFPVSPLDGGRIVSVLSTKIWLIGLLIMVPVLFLSPDPLLLLIFIFGLVTWWNRARESYKAKVLTIKKQQQKAYISELNSLMDDMYFVRMNQEGEPEPVLMSDMRVFKIREYRNRQQELKQEIEDRSSFLIPFLQDRKKLERDRLKIELEFENKKEQFVDGFSTEYESLKRKISESENELKRIEEKEEKLQTYYDAPAKTKWTVLVLYIGLAIILSAFLVYGMNIMESHSDLMSV